ncbi:MAG: hypothetical protein ACFFCZ_05990 [Promethearchaeota archaeon]
MNDDSRWSELVVTFEQSVEEAKGILETSDLSQPVPFWGGMSIWLSYWPNCDDTTVDGQMVASRKR